MAEINYIRSWRRFFQRRDGKVPWVIVHLYLKITKQLALAYYKS